MTHRRLLVRETVNGNMGEAQLRQRNQQIYRHETFLKTFGLNIYTSINKIMKDIISNRLIPGFGKRGDSTTRLMRQL